MVAKSREETSRDFAFLYKKLPAHFSRGQNFLFSSIGNNRGSVGIGDVCTVYVLIVFTVYYVADIYVASIDNFVTRVANDDMSYYSTQNSEALDKAANAILSMCGDFMTYQKGGFMMRNGEIYADDHNLNSICVLYSNGEMETFDGKSYKIDKIKEKDPVQVWSFGPALLDKDGKTRAKYTVSSTVAQRNPRSAVGYYEPGHYCFVVVDGRQKHSAGIKIPNLATIFEELGCKAAYNLDGGGSAVMMFDHKTYSKQSNGADRKLGDLLVIRDSYYGAKEVSE
jgi:exopolysaccharide biosynthesis protein